MPALHISLGTYLKLFNMLEHECCILDIKLAGIDAGSNEIDNAQIQVYKKMTDLERISADLEEKIKLVNEAIILNVFKNPENEKQIKMTFQPRLDYLKCKLEEKVKKQC